MSEEKKFTAKETAIIVLKKAEEILNKSSLTKAESKWKQSKTGTHSLWHGTAQATIKSHKDGQTHTVSYGDTQLGEQPDMTHYHKGTVESAKQAAETKLKAYSKIHKAEEDVTPSDNVQTQVAPENNIHEQKEGNNQPWGTAPGIKGHVKLAKFCGHVEQKRKMKSAPVTPINTQNSQNPEMDKSDPLVNDLADNTKKRAEGYKARGDMKSHKIALEGNKEGHKQKLADIKAQPKPNLPGKKD